MGTMRDTRLPLEDVGDEDGEDKDDDEEDEDDDPTLSFLPPKLRAQELAGRKRG